MLLSWAFTLFAGYTSPPEIATRHRPVKVTAVRGSRFGNDASLDGRGADLMNKLADPNLAGPFGLFPDAVDVALVGSIGPTTLKGTDILFVGGVPADSPSMFGGDELQHMRDFWQRGGNLIFLGDDPAVVVGSNTLLPWWQRDPFNPDSVSPPGPGPLANWTTANTVSNTYFAAGGPPDFFNSSFFGGFDTNGIFAGAGTQQGFSFFTGTNFINNSGGPAVLVGTTVGGGGAALVISDRDWFFGPANAAARAERDQLFLNMVAFLSASDAYAYFSGSADVFVGDSYSISVYFNTNIGVSPTGFFDFQTPSGSEVWAYINNAWAPCPVGGIGVRCGDENTHWTSSSPIYIYGDAIDEGALDFTGIWQPSLPTSQAQLFTQVIDVFAPTKPILQVTRRGPASVAVGSTIEFNVHVVNPLPFSLNYSTSFRGLQGNTRVTPPVSNGGFSVPLGGTYDTLFSVTAASTGPLDMIFDFTPSTPGVDAFESTQHVDVLNASGQLVPALVVGSFAIHAAPGFSFGDTLSSALFGPRLTAFSDSVAFGSAAPTGSGTPISFRELVAQPDMVTAQDLAPFDLFLLSSQAGYYVGLSNAATEAFASWVAAGGVLLLDVSDAGAGQGFADFQDRFGITPVYAFANYPTMQFIAPAATLASSLFTNTLSGSFGFGSNVTLSQYDGYTTLIEGSGAGAPNPDPVPVVSYRQFDQGTVFAFASQSWWYGLSDSLSGPPPVFTPAPAELNAKLYAGAATPRLRAVAAQVGGGKNVNFPLPLTLTNDGRVDLLNVDIELVLDPALNFVRAEGAVCAAGPAPGSPQAPLPLAPAATHHCQVQLLRAKETKTISLIVIAPSAPGPFSITFAAAPSIAGEDTTADNTAVAGVGALTDPVDLQLTVGGAPDSIARGQSFTVNLQAKNAAAIATDGVAVAVSFTPNTTPLGAPNGCTVNGTRLVCAIGALGAGETRSFDVTVAVDDDFSLRTLSAAVSGNNFDPNPANNTYGRSYGLGEAPAIVSAIITNPLFPLSKKGGCSSTGTAGLTSALLVLATALVARRRR